MIYLRRKQTCIFDWDGTIFDSMPIKYKTFASVFYGMLPVETKARINEREIEMIYRAYSGRPRKQIAEKAADACSLDMEAFSFQEFSENLTRRNKAALLEAHIFDDFWPFLELISQAGIKAYISSSVPQDELTHFTSVKLGDKVGLFAGIYGSDANFHKGEPHFLRIEHESATNRANMAFFGDEPADLALSRASNIDFVHVNRVNRSLAPKITEVISLSEVVFVN